MREKRREKNAKEQELLEQQKLKAFEGSGSSVSQKAQEKSQVLFQSSFQHMPPADFEKQRFQVLSSQGQRSPEWRNYDLIKDSLRNFK